MSLENLNISKISCEIYKTLSSNLLELLMSLGIKHLNVHSRRALLLHEKTLLPFLPPTTSLDEDAEDVFEFYVLKDQSESLIKHIIKELSLNIPGRGSIYVEDVQIINPESLSFLNSEINFSIKSEDQVLLKKLYSINCIVQRGRGNEIARHALEAGTNVPSISFGIGTGLRNKLGLIRITIPAEKEVVSVIVNEHDKDEIMNFLVEAGHLDRPGNGFIGITPVHSGILNTKTFRGKQRHSASMEQVISAIDQIKSGTDWRRKTSTVNHKSGKYLNKTFLKDMVNMTLVCNEGKSDDLITAALAAGAGGATISKIKYSLLNSQTDTLVATQVSPARESISMGVAPSSVKPILEAITQIGAFTSEFGCLVETKPMPLACTYLGKK